MDAHRLSGPFLEVPQSFPVLLPTVLVPSGRSSVRTPRRFRGGRLGVVARGLLHATVVHHARKVLGAMVAHGGAVMPPGGDTSADEEPEETGGPAVEKDVLVWMHAAESMADVGDFYTRARAMDDDSVRRWLGTVPMTLAIQCRRSGI